MLGCWVENSFKFFSEFEPGILENSLKTVQEIVDFNETHFVP